MARVFEKLIEPVSSDKTSTHLYMNGISGICKVNEFLQFFYLKASEPQLLLLLGVFYLQPEENEHSL